MDADTARLQLSALGFNVRDGYVTMGNHRFGRVTETRFSPEGHEGGIPLEGVAMFSSISRGSDGVELVASLRDGSQVTPIRTEVRTKSLDACFKHDQQGRPLMPQSISDLFDVWPYLFSDFHERCWTETTTNDIMVDPAMYGGQGHPRALDDTALINVTRHVQNRLKEYGCTGGQPGKDTVYDVIKSLADGNRRNRFLEMMNEGEWDGTERLSRLFIDAFGGRMADLSKEESDTVLSELATRWFIGAVARQYETHVQVDVIPIMTGAQGIRKSNAARWMAARDEFFTEVSDFDERRFVEQTKGRLVGELSELMCLKRSDSNHLKMMISKTTDRVRLPYDRLPTEVPRRFVLIGTSNESEFLNDPTGARRFFPFETEPSRCTLHFGDGGFRSEEAREYIRQVWYEAHHRYLAGEGWDMDSEVLEIARRPQRSATVSDPLVDVLEAVVAQEFPEIGSMICMNDLRSLISGQATSDEVDRAARTWWKTSRQDWGPSRQTRIKNDGTRKWLTTTDFSGKFRERLLPAGTESGRKGLLGV